MPNQQAYPGTMPLPGSMQQMAQYTQMYTMPPAQPMGGMQMPPAQPAVMQAPLPYQMQAYQQPQYPQQPQQPQQQPYIAPYSQNPQANPYQQNVQGQPQMQMQNAGYPQQPLANTQDIMNSAQILRRAMKGLGTDEMAIIRVIATHGWRERAAIAESFCAQYGMTLDRELSKELSFNLKKLIKGAFTDRYVYWAQKIDDAIRGAGTDDKRLIQLVIMMNDEDTRILNQVYRQMFNRDMFTAIQRDISNNDWGRLLKAWMKGENTCNIDPQ